LPESAAFTQRNWQIANSKKQKFGDLKRIGFSGFAREARDVELGTLNRRAQRA
jgi:hypothetical protein